MSFSAVNAIAIDRSHSESTIRVGPWLEPLVFAGVKIGARAALVLKCGPHTKKKIKRARREDRQGSAPAALRSSAHFLHAIPGSARARRRMPFAHHGRRRPMLPGTRCLCGFGATACAAGATRAAAGTEQRPGG